MAREFVDLPQYQSTSNFTDLPGLVRYLGDDPGDRKAYKRYYMEAWRGRIPHMKRGKRLVFDLRQIDVWLQSLQRVSVEDAIERSQGVDI